ncbi:4Fe-4S cluster-binding domain-containing protein, partial [Neglectibacter timonensis]|uniref:4Fe-4S cluster-binding domain-containing protein n=1 Tax=Neglectibacter timonensis TaxID=1776382 RepID=UPI003994FE06
MTNGSETGMIFNLQKFSLHDGPGIRTVVFLKGCPLRCKWCSNPESQFAGSQLLWDSARCLRCGGCAARCS